MYKSYIHIKLCHDNIVIIYIYIYISVLFVITYTIIINIHDIILYYVI